MSEKDVGPKETLIMEVPGSAPRSATPAPTDARSIDDSWDTEDPATDIRPVSGGHLDEPATMARPQASRQSDDPKSFASRPSAGGQPSPPPVERANDADAPSTIINHRAPEEDAPRTIINQPPHEEDAPRTIINQPPHEEDAPRTITNQPRVEPPPAIATPIPHDRDVPKVVLNLTNEDEDPATALRPLAERASNPPSQVGPLLTSHSTMQMAQQPPIAMAPPTSGQPPLSTPLPMPRRQPPAPQLGSFAVGALAGLVALFLVGVVTTIYLLVSHRDPARGANAASASRTNTALANDALGPTTSDASLGERGAPSDTSQSSGNPISTAVSGSPDDQAKAALARLRDGINDCVKNTIHLLPGTSPPVPESLGWLKHGPYVSTLHDWVGPFFSCTKFKSAEPIPFMIQWQLEKPGDHGNAIAWIDSDQDGKADRAYGFSAHLKEHGVVEFGEIGPVDAAQKPAKH